MLTQDNTKLDKLPQIMIHTCNEREWYVYA